MPAALCDQFRSIVADARADEVLQELLRRHREPHRHYHGPGHVRSVVSAVNAAAGSDAVVLAAWFHDAVYDPRSSTNEADSANLATELLLACLCPAALVADVERLVLATRDHTPTQSDEAMLIDADLAILAADPNVYDRYVVGVRMEYQHVADAQWQVGRAHVLQGFLHRERIFHTTLGMDRAVGIARAVGIDQAAPIDREAAARANIRRELQALGPPR